MTRFTALVILVCSLHAASAHEFEQYFIDGTNSTFVYQGSSFVDGSCRNAPCEFRLDGSFEAAVGEWGARYRNLSLSISSDSEFDSVESLLPTAEAAFLGGTSNVLLPSQGSHPNQLGVFANSGSSVVDGVSVTLRAAAVSQSALDCNGDGNLSLDDVNCLAGQENFDAVFSALKLRPGDFDGDGQVEFDDFLVLSNQFGKDGRYVDGDADGNGTVEFGDFLLLSSNFGSASAAVNAPEPVATNWFFLWLLLCLRSKKLRELASSSR